MGLEIRYTVTPYRGFESHPFRQRIKNKGRCGVLCFWRFAGVWCGKSWLCPRAFHTVPHLQLQYGVAVRIDR